MRGKKHSDETRAAALAALLEGQGVSEVAKKYKLPHSTVSRLKKQLPQNELDEVGRKKRENISDLISTHLEESLKATARIARQTNDDEWLSKQPASELATFFGVITDKTVRILEAIENASTQKQEGE